MAESIKKINTEIEKIENYNQALSYNVNKHSKKLEIIEKILHLLIILVKK